MYDKFYHFLADPFRLSPDHAFCYRHPSYAKGRAYMEYALDAAEGFVVVTGKPGMGKTTLINDLLANTSLSKYLTASIVTTRLDADDLLRSIAYEFSLNVENADKATIIQKLKRLFVLSTRNARPPLLIVDEAQNLSLGALEELRLLTNMQYEGLPLLQIFLLGQDELREKLLDPKLEQLRQRISAATQLEPLSEEHTGSYIVHRLGVVGWKNHPRISRAAVSVLHQTCQGVPRRINQFCSRLFLLGAGEERERLTAEDARLVARELTDEGLTPSSAEFQRKDQTVDDSEDLAADWLIEAEESVTDRKESLEPSDPDASADAYPDLNDKVLDLSERRDSLPTATPLPSPGEAPARVETARLAPSPLETPELGTGDGGSRREDGETPQVAAFLRASAANDNEVSSARQEIPLRPVSADDWPDEDDYDDDPPRRGFTAFRVALVLLLIASGVLFYLDWRDGLKDWFADNSVDFMSQLKSMRESSLFEESRPDRAVRSTEGFDPSITGRSGEYVAGAPSEAGVDGEPVRSSVVLNPDIDPVPESDVEREVGYLREPDGDSIADPAARPQRAAPEHPDAGGDSEPRGVEEVQFGFDSARLDDESAQALDRVVQTLEGFESSVAILVGHTDDTGPAAYNHRLSIQRAEAVARYLAEQAISEERLIVGEAGRTVLVGTRVPRPVSKRSVQVVIVDRP